MPPPPPPGYPAGYPPYPSSSGRSSSSHDTPHSTLYVTGLPRDVTEREISIMFRMVPFSGFKSCRLVAKGDRTYIAFVDFIDTPSATYAMEHLQGFRMDTNDPHGIVIEYDRGSRK
eukprot:GEZU01007584.1.p2 GENE.GEZU01007584.1~~GEZU01007584.1.p2  ORF type:complete len:116 (+),score=15.34 GEZU01007584.1:193-540(+)